MKKVMLTAIILLLTFASYCQQNPQVYNDDLRYQRDVLLIKADKQKKSAWICLGAGAGLFSAGVLMAAATLWSEKPKGGAAVLIGTASMLSSIPLFIASGKNRRKARLLVTSQRASFISPLAVSKKITGLTLFMSL